MTLHKGRSPQSKKAAKDYNAALWAINQARNEGLTELALLHRVAELTKGRVTP